MIAVAAFQPHNDSLTHCGNVEMKCKTTIYINIPGGARKTSRTFAWRYATEYIVEMNQQKSTYVMSKHLRICLGILA